MRTSIWSTIASSFDNNGYPVHTLYVTKQWHYRTVIKIAFTNNLKGGKQAPSYCTWSHNGKCLVRVRQLVSSSISAGFRSKSTRYERWPWIVLSSGHGWTVIVLLHNVALTLQSLPHVKWEHFSHSNVLAFVRSIGNIDKMHANKSAHNSRLYESCQQRGQSQTSWTDEDGLTGDDIKRWIRFSLVLHCFFDVAQRHHCLQP